MPKLHLGCGTAHLNGYTNIDIRYLPGVDAVDNIRHLRGFQIESVDEIYACHVLEHFSRWSYKDVLKRWYDLLKSDGILKVCVPDFEQVCKYYLKTRKLRDISGILFGGQDYEENYHYWCWDFDTLKGDLMQIGFKNVERYDWHDTSHAGVDDYSQSYLPHMDKDNGTLMSLNIMALK